MELARVTKDLMKAKEDANRAHQERRDMKDQLDRTFAEKLQLEDQAKKAEVFKMMLDETTSRLLQKEDEVEVLLQNLGERQN